MRPKPNSTIQERATYLPVFRNGRGREKVFQAYDSILESTGLEFEEIYLHTRLGETHILKSGFEGNPPLLLVHAYYSSAASWYKNLKELSENFLVYNVDIVGDPNKSRPTRIIREVDDFVLWFDDIMNGLRLTSAAFVGNSVGAFHIVNYYLHSPHRVERMALIGPAATFRQIIPFYFHTFPGGMTGWTFLVNHAIRWIENGVAFEPSFRRLFYLLLKHGKATNQVFPTVFSDEELMKIDIPTLLIYGERENIYDYSLSIERARRLIRNLRVRIIANGNHITGATNSDMVNHELVEFLRNPVILNSFRKTQAVPGRL